MTRQYRPPWTPGILHLEYCRTSPCVFSWHCPRTGYLRFIRIEPHCSVSFEIPFLVNNCLPRIALQSQNSFCITDDCEQFRIGEHIPEVLYVLMLFLSQVHKPMCAIALLCFMCKLSLPPVYSIFLISFSNVIESSFLLNSLYPSRALTWFFTSMSHSEMMTVYRFCRFLFSTFSDFR